MDDRKLNLRIGEILSAWFSASGLRSFSLKNGEDHEGEEALFINIIVDNDRPIDPSALLGANSQIREELYRQNDKRLPYIKLSALDASHEAAE
jgi:hypothetical protein